MLNGLDPNARNLEDDLPNVLSDVLPDVPEPNVPMPDGTSLANVNLA